jgi:uncharacterized membrane protein
MDAYAVVKYLHVLFVIIWLGGGFGLVVLATNADRARNDAQLIQIIQNVIFMSSRVFVPAALLALICGLTLVYLNWSFGDLWVIVGLAGFALTFVTDVAVIKPRADRVVAAIKAEGVSPAVIEQGRQILSIAQFDFVMLFIVVADMVLKPAPANYVTLVIMAAALIVGAVLFLGRLRRMPA